MSKVKNKKLKKNNFFKKEVLNKIIFCLSLPFVTFLLSSRLTDVELYICMFLSFGIGVFFGFKLFKDMFSKYNYKLISIALVAALFIEKVWINNIIVVENHVKELANLLFNYTFSHDTIAFVLVILSLPALTELIYILLVKTLPIVKKIIANFNKTDKKIIVITTIVGFILSFVIYNITSVFYSPTYKLGDIELDRIYDVIYTTDSSYIYNDNAYLNINMAENDIRQPFFGIFATPFAIIAYILSDLLSFIPNSYAVLINTMQIMLLAVSVILITKMLGLSKKDSVFYYVLSFCTFPLILFSFVMEQYIFCLFYLILAIYIWYFNIIETNYFYLGAVGTLLTSGIIFPLISKLKSFKKWIINVLKCFAAFVCTTIIFGQLHIILNSKTGITRLLVFSGKDMPLMDKLYQFLYFARSIFIAPQGIIINSGIPSYRLTNIDFICVTGIVILVLCFLSFLLNRKNKLAIISFLWIIFSFIILGLVGWGALENGLILYSLYFSWAYIVLLYLLLDKVIKNIKVKHIIMLALCLILLCFNVPEFIRIVKFGLTYYRF